MPAALRRALDTELARTDVPIDSVAQERSSAKLFASLAMRMIAPRSLRRAGYEALAVACENERDYCPGGAAALAQHMIGREFSSTNTPWPASSAYGACAHASTCAFYAGQDEIETVIQAGTYSARALISLFPYDDDGAAYDDTSAEESDWIWNRAVASINLATERC